MCNSQNAVIIKTTKPFQFHRNLTFSRCRLLCNIVNAVLEMKALTWRKEVYTCWDSLMTCVIKQLLTTKWCSSHCRLLSGNWLHPEPGKWLRVKCWWTPSRLGVGCDPLSAPPPPLTTVRWRNGVSYNGCTKHNTPFSWHFTQTIDQNRLCDMGLHRIASRVVI